MKTLFYLKTFKLVLFCYFLLYQTINVFAGRTQACPDCYPPLGGYSRISANSNLSQSKRLQTFDVSALNLKKTSEQKSVQQTNSAISISLADFNSISAVGNTWLLYQTNNETFSMNIGTANSSTPQTWTLPANLYTYFAGAGRSDFIAPSSVPAGLEIAGANKVMLTKYFDSNDNPMDVYDHYFIDGDGIDNLGTSFDLEFGEDDTFNEPDYEYSDVPLDLGDVFVSTIEEEDYETNLTLTRYVQTITADAFGTISTPDGVLNCLRLRIVNQRFTRPTESNAFTLQSTTNEVTFMTREGVYFTGTVSATSGTVNVSKFQYREIIPTSLLADQTDVRINNDSKGVTINSDNDTAHPSAILDIKDNNLGILIPRIAQANRPTDPAEGLLVYQIDQTPGFYYYDGSGWRILGSSPSARLSAEETIQTTRNIENQTGFANLKRGTAFIKFNTKIENPENLIINLQMEGEGNGLFVSKKTTEGFEVREIKKGKSNARFSYVMNVK